MNDPVLVGYEDFLWCLVMSCERGTSFGTGTTQFRCNLLSQETCRKSVEGASVFREVSMSAQAGARLHNFNSAADIYVFSYVTCTCLQF